jgi:hypothetical protein
MDFFGAYDTKMLLKVVFDRTAYVKFIVSDNFKQKINKNTFKTTINP